MHGYRYDGSPLTRGEFVTHMERVEETLKSIDDRVAAIEDRLHRNRRRMLAALGHTSVRLLVIGSTAAATYAAARYGVPLSW